MRIGRITKVLGVFLAVIVVNAAIWGAEELTTGERVVAAARQQIGVTKAYDPRYRTLSYPGGDVPLQTGPRGEPNSARSIRNQSNRNGVRVVKKW